MALKVVWKTAGKLKLCCFLIPLLFLSILLISGCTKITTVGEGVGTKDKQYPPEAVKSSLLEHCKEQNVSPCHAQWNRCQEEGADPCYKELNRCEEWYGISNKWSLCAKVMNETGGPTYPKWAKQEGITLVAPEVCEEEENSLSFEYCHEELESLTSNITRRALAENDPTLCDELEGLRPLCYFRFARNLGFSLADVIQYDMSGRFEDLCARLNGTLQEKCYFNLALEKLDDDYCNLTGEYMERCIQNVFWWERQIPGQFELFIEKRMTRRNASLGMGSEGWGNAEMYYPGDLGVLTIYNGGSEILDGSKFRYYRNLRLIDIDGCENEAILPISEERRRHDPEVICKLFHVKQGQEAVLEVTYEGETVYVAWSG